CSLAHLASDGPGPCIAMPQNAKWAARRRPIELVGCCCRRVRRRRPRRIAACRALVVQRPGIDGRAGAGKGADAHGAVEGLGAAELDVLEVVAAHFVATDGITVDEAVAGAFSLAALGRDGEGVELPAGCTVLGAVDVEAGVVVLGSGLPSDRDRRSGAGG